MVLHFGNTSLKRKLVRRQVSETDD